MGIKWWDRTSGSIIREMTGVQRVKFRSMLGFQIKICSVTVIDPTTRSLGPKATRSPGHPTRPTGMYVTEGGGEMGVVIIEQESIVLEKCYGIRNLKLTQDHREYHKYTSIYCNSKYFIDAIFLNT